MADALCGPSNPLQNLQKYSQVDRTLQQDRLVASRHSPAQGFRTVDPRAGSLDAEFRAFENSSPNPLAFQPPEFLNAPFHPHHVRPASALASASWATDFQRLNIHEQPLPAGQFHAEAPLVRTSPGGWQHDFLRQRSSASTPVSQGKQVLREPQFKAPMYGEPPASAMLPYAAPLDQAFHDGMVHAEQPLQGMGPEMSAEFDAAFADAIALAHHVDQAQASPQQDTMPLSDVGLDQTDFIKIGSDAIHYREQSERSVQQDPQDADELARTAGQLLNSVQHEKSSKFQNSQFLDLMRRIRDREVEVQNNELQDVHQTQNQTGLPVQPVEQDDLVATLRQTVAPPTAEAARAEQRPDAHFEFPDMDAVYAPPDVASHRSPFTTYGFDDDQYPQASAANQMEALHPGGRWYPEQNPQLDRPEPQMSGAAIMDDQGAPFETSISASQLDKMA